MDRLAAMRSFRRVVELGSFAAAARDLGLSAPAISKHVSELETSLNATLLHRTTRSLSVTEAGRLVFDHCVRVLDDMAEIERAVCAGASRPRGRLRINAPMSFGLTRLSPILPAFVKQYPELELDLTLADQETDPVEEGFDVALRIRSDLANSSLIGRRIALVRRVLCAAPAYLEEAGTPSTLTDLAGHRCLVYSLSTSPHVWHFAGTGGGSVAVQGRFAANNSIVLRDAALAGLGLCLAPLFVLRDEIAAGRLVRLLPDLEPTAHQLYALYPPQRSLPAKTRSFIDFVVERFGGEGPFDGELAAQPNGMQSTVPAGPTTSEISA